MTFQRVPIRSWAELFALPNFVEGQLPHDDMTCGEVVHDYDMPLAQGERPCGMSSCSHGHRKGYVIEFPDFRLSHVGKDCGKTLFGVTWAARLRNFAADKAARAKLIARQEAKAAASLMIERVQVDTVRNFGLAGEMLKAFDALPAPLRDSVESRAQINDPIIHGWRKPTAAEIELAEKKGKKHPPVSIQFEVGKLDGLQYLRRNKRADVVGGVEIPAALATLGKVAADDKRSTDDITSAMRVVREAQSKLLDCVDGTLRFFSAENLKLLLNLPAAQRLKIKRIEVTDSSPITIVTE